MRGHDITEQPSRIRRAGLGGRRPSSRPRPVRPGVVPVGVRPVQPARPATPAGSRRSAALSLWGSSLGATLGTGLLGPGLLRAGLLGQARRSEQRVLTRRSPVARPITAPGPRPRALVVAALTVAAAVVVVLLGLLADEVTAARAGAPAAPVAAAPAAFDTAVDAAFDPADGTVTVTVGTEVTVWEVAERVAPSSSGPEVAALAERLVTDNGLSTVRVHPGQVLRVTAG
jgi:hypothetical protein